MLKKKSTNLSEFRVHMSLGITIKSSMTLSFGTQFYERMSANKEYPKPSPTPTIKNPEPQQLQAQGGGCIA